MSFSNLELAIAYLRHVERGDIGRALDMASDELTYWLPGPGTMNKAQFLAFFGPLGDMVDSIRFHITGATVENERVALEAESKANLNNGRTYENKYHFLFEFRDGKIKAIREYADSAPAIAAFFAPGAA